MGHPDPNFKKPLEVDYIRLIPKANKKPNPQVLIDICKCEQVKPSDAWYVGDSLIRDISMANLWEGERAHTLVIQLEINLLLSEFLFSKQGHGHFWESSSYQAYV